MSTEDNLIAEFLGFDILSNDRYQYESEIITSLPSFKDDWNWLMKIVEKIEPMVGLISTIASDFSIIDRKWKNKFESNEGSRKENIYQVCLYYINWYNKTEFEKRFLLAKAQILEDIANRYIPDTIKSFSDLDAVADANCYGGFCDENYTPSENFVLENQVQDAINDWLKNGRKK